jgi:hypothetical protein
MIERLALAYVEIDIPFCANTYGAAPCTASIPATGPIKCFNSPKTCQDPEHFVETLVTLRFAVDTDYLPREIDALPLIRSHDDIQFTPATVSLGRDLGTRATLSVTFRDAPHSDTGDGFDKYRAERSYVPFKRGTFWGKFRARQPFLRGRAMRWISGLAGDALADMETRHFIIDSFDGPTPDGKYTILAKDILKLADGDRAQAPALSNGFLAADITISATSAQLLPSGIGDAEYPASGFLAIGGNEVVSFTRAGDVLTIARSLFGSTASEHKAQDRAQLVLRYAGEDVADIIYDLLVNYAEVDAAYCALSEWQAETASFLGSVYTANICEPTSVATLVSELIEQAALALWDDNLAQKIRLRVLRGILTDADTFTPDNTLLGTMTLKEQPDTRLSRVQTYFGTIDPTKPLSNLDNFRSTSLVIDADAESDYGSAAIKTIYSRWIPQAGRAVADRLGAIQLGRFRDPPRRVGFSVMRYADTDAVLGQGYRVESFCVQDATGALSDIPIQVTRLSLAPDRFIVEAEEMLFTAPDVDLANRIIIFDANNYNIDLRVSHDSIYPAPVSGDVVTCTVNASVIIGSVDAAVPAFAVGSWPAGVVIHLVVLGRIQGKGGRGGAGGLASGGDDGGIALYARFAINMDVAAGAVWGGGGGGGGSPTGGGGGGGAGQDPGLGGGSSAGSAGSPGTATSGGTGGAPGGIGAPGADGGGPGIAGDGGGAFTFAGGQAGAAIDGISFIAVTGPGDIRGVQIN